MNHVASKSDFGTCKQKAKTILSIQTVGSAFLLFSPAKV